MIRKINEEIGTPQDIALEAAIRLERAYEMISVWGIKELTDKQAILFADRANMISEYLEDFEDYINRR